MDVKCIFLNDYLVEEVCVELPPEFVDEKLPHYMLKLPKELYGLN